MKKITLTADIIIEYPDGSIILAKRGSEPFKGHFGLPGGKMEENGETIEETAVREAKEETGLNIELTGIVGVYSKPGRDPRGRFISVVYTAKIVGGTLKAGSDAAEVIKTLNFANHKLAFDHNRIIEDYINHRNAEPRGEGNL